MSQKNLASYVKIRSMLKFLLVGYYVLGWNGDGNICEVFVEVALDYWKWIHVYSKWSKIVYNIRDFYVHVIKVLQVLFVTTGMNLKKAPFIKLD